jgi:hypothetical protein
LKESFKNTLLAVFFERYALREEVKLDLTKETTTPFILTKPE